MTKLIPDSNKTRFCKSCKKDYLLTEEFWSFQIKRIRCRACKNKVAKVQYEKHKAEYVEKVTRGGYAEGLTHVEKQRAIAFKRNRTVKGRYRSLKGNARSRGYDFNLDILDYAELIKDGICSYCGGMLDPAGGGLDRIDASLGYFAENLVTCCRKCNMAKNQMSVEEFKQWVTKVYLLFQKKEEEVCHSSIQ